MTEAELLAEIIRLCEQLGLLYHHCPNSTRCQGPRGLPDLIIAGPAGVLFAEAKSAGGKLEPGQIAWRYTLAAAGVRWHVWRPADWHSGTIKAQLHRLRHEEI